MLTWELEDWITDVGAAVLHKRYSNPGSLSPVEGLIHEVWLLDTEARNGGLSQYFLNHGLTQWKSCCASAASLGLLSFSAFEAEVNSMIEGSEDLFQDINSRGASAEDLWSLHHCAVVIELRALAENAL